MAYPARLLNDDETVTVDLHPHWWFLAVPALTVVAAIAGGIVTLVLTDYGTMGRTVAAWASMAAIAVAVCWLLGRYCRWLTTHFVVTDRRLIYRGGVIVKHGIEIPLDRVHTVHFRQGLLERLVGAGDLVIESGAESGLQRFTEIRQPDRVQREIHAQMAAQRARRGGDVDIAGQLERLEMLRDRGTITDVEFEQQKRRLLEP